VHVLEQDHPSAQLTKIEQFVFFECTSLSETTLPPNLTDIGQYAFSQCTSLVEIALPSGMALSRDAAVSMIEELTPVWPAVGSHTGI